MLDAELLDKQLPPRRRRIGSCSQFLTLMRRKELPRLFARPLSCACSVLLPVALTSLIVLGTQLSPTTTGGGISLAPTDFSASEDQTNKLVQTIYTVRKARTAVYDVNTGTPAAIPSLATFLNVSQAAPKELPYSLSDKASLPPFDGSILAIAPATDAVRSLMREVLKGAPDYVEVEPDGPDKLDPRVSHPYERRLHLQTRAFRAARLANRLSALAASNGTFTVQYFNDVSEVEAQAEAGRAIWACVSFLTTPPSSNWSYALRFPSYLNKTGAPCAVRTAVCVGGTVLLGPKSNVSLRCCNFCTQEPRPLESVRTSSQPASRPTGSAILRPDSFPSRLLWMMRSSTDRQGLAQRLRFTAPLTLCPNTRTTNFSAMRAL